MVSHLNRSHIINVQLAMYSLKADNDLNFSVSLSEDLNGLHNTHKAECNALHTIAAVIISDRCFC